VHHKAVLVANQNTLVEAGVKPTNAPFAGTPVATGNVLDNAINVDAGTGDILHVKEAHRISTHSYGNFVLHADGTYEYDLDNSNPLVLALAVGETATEVWSYTVTNLEGQTSQTTLTFTIVGTDKAPVIAPQTTINKVSTAAATHSFLPSVSADGNFIAFDGSSQLPGPGGGQPSDGHVYLYDRVSGTTTQIDQGTPPHAGEVFNGVSISFDGRFAVFQGNYGTSTAPASEIFVYDRDTGVTTRLEDPTTHAAINGGNAKISANGQFIAMEHGGNQLLVADRNGTIVNTITTTDGHTLDPAIDASGRFIAFQSTTASQISVGSSNFAPAHNDGTLELYVYDRTANSITAVAALGAPGNADNNLDFTASMSAGGNKIVFASDVSPLVAGVATTHTEVYVYDRSSGTPVLKLLSADSNGNPANSDSVRPEISPDGNYVTFSSAATNLVAGATGGQPQTYIYNLLTNTLQLVSAAADGTPGNGDSSFGASLSGNGTGVAFAGTADNLVPGDTNGKSDVFLVDRSGGTQAAVTEDVNRSSAFKLETKGTLPFSDVNLSDAHTVSVAAKAGAIGTLTAIVSTDSTTAPQRHRHRFAWGP